MRFGFVAWDQWLSHNKTNAQTELLIISFSAFASDVRIHPAKDRVKYDLNATQLLKSVVLPQSIFLAFFHFHSLYCLSTRPQRW